MIVELRQYTLVPGRRDELIELFEREFVTSQEALGIRLLGLFRDLGDPDRFVWLRAFPDMASRAAALSAFYGGPVWHQHRDAANATMLDSDNVLLLHSITGLALSSPTHQGGGRVELTVCLGGAPFSDAVVASVTGLVRPLAAFRTEYAANNFPALPVRNGEHAFVWLTRGGAADERWRDEIGPALLGVPEILLLEPTSLSAL